MRWLLRPYADRTPYTALGYLLAGLPIGVVGFTLAIVGLTVGAAMFITLAGIPILIAAFRFLHRWAAFERRFATAALDVTIPDPPRSGRPSSGWWWRDLVDELGRRTTFRELAWVVVRLPLAVLGFAAAVVIVTLMLGGFALPIVHLAGTTTEVGTWQIDTLAESLVFVPFSLAFCAVGARLLLSVGHAVGAITQYILGYVEPADFAAAVEGVVADRAIDPFELYGILERRLGVGPWLTKTRVAATLLELEASGRIISTREKHTVTYATAPSARW